MRGRKPIVIIQGAQFGSEGKGMVAAALCERRNIDFAVRTGGINAGHTVWHKGAQYKMQQLPTGWVNPGTTLVIGPGAYVNPEQLYKEIGIIRAAGAKNWIFVDYRAGLHLPEHAERSADSGRHYTMGATGKGCSEAVLDRIRLRGKGGMLFKGWLHKEYGPGPYEIGQGFQFADTVKLLHSAYDNEASILLEGTQGTWLDMYLGPYPYTTHKQTTAAQWVAEAGLSPAMEYEVVLCARTYPIRVAGNSGPMPDEIDWVTLGHEINNKLWMTGMVNRVKEMSLHALRDAYCELRGSYGSDLVEKSNRWTDAYKSLSQITQDDLANLVEMTTVTKKVRRVARMDMEMLKESVRINRPSWIALTFLNYEFPELWDEVRPMSTCLPHGAMDYMCKIEEIECEVRAFTTGPRPENFHYFDR